MKSQSKSRKEALKIILSEIERREQLVKKPELIDLNYPEQAAFVRDPARFVAAFTTRRAGKSSGFAYKFFRAALKHKDVMLPYIALTRDSAKNIMWPVLKEIAKKENIPCEFRESDLTCKVQGGSEIKLFGADMKNFMDRLRGIKTPLATIDECQGFRSHVEELVDDVLTAATADFEDGQLCVAGTPGPVPKGYFYDVTKGKAGFRVHSWSAFSNPYIKAKAFVDDLMQRKGWDWSNPTIRREWLGEWVADFDALVYKFDEKLNRASSLSEAKEWTYVIGVDLGYNPDPTAFVICAYNEFDPNLYIVETYKETKLIISDVVERLNYYLKTYRNAYIVMDAADKQAVEEMKQRYGLGIEAAEKHGKAGFIELMNSDMKRGLIKVLQGQGEDLVEEWQNLIWDAESEKRIEDSRYANHLSDGALYAWRYCYNFLWRERPRTLAPQSEERVELWWEKESEKLNKKEGEFDDYEDAI